MPTAVNTPCTENSGPGGTNGTGAGAPCCQLEALVSIDARGQIVLPKDLREKAGLGAGDKLAVISLVAKEQVACIGLVRTDVFGDVLRGLLGTTMGEILQS